jgi:hypothetical protein
MENKSIRDILKNGTEEEIKNLKKAMIKHTIKENYEALSRMAKDNSTYPAGKSYEFWDNEEDSIYDEKLIVENLGNEYFNINKEEFIELPKDMSAQEYKQWRKELKNN